MARIRSVHASFALDEELAALPDHVQLAHAYIPCHLDKAGRCEDRPAKLRALVFPYRVDIDMDEVLGSLAGIGKLIRYEVAGRRYVQWLDFAQQHHPHHKEADSTLPAPSEHGASPVLVRDACADHPEPAPNQPTGLLSLVSCGGHGHGEGGGVNAPPPDSSSTPETTPGPSADVPSRYLAGLPAVYLEATGAPIGDTTRFRTDVERTFGGRRDTDIDRLFEITRSYLKVAGPDKAFPYNWTDLPNLFRNWPQIEADAVKDGIVLPLDAEGRPVKTWKHICRELNHYPPCRLESACKQKIQRAAEDKTREEERQREIEAAGGLEQYEVLRKQKMQEMFATHKWECSVCGATHRGTAQQAKERHCFTKDAIGPTRYAKPIEVSA